MKEYEIFNIQLLMNMKEEVEKTGHLPKADALYLIQTIASLIIQQGDTDEQLKYISSEGSHIIEERVYH